MTTAAANTLLHRMTMPVDEVAEAFSDLKPVPQDEGPLDPVCSIQYPASFKLAYGYFRAVLSAGEHSRRSLRLSALCLRLNPANYTVWQYRRRCLKELGLRNSEEAIRQDLDLAAALGGSNPKNYQIWYHRRALLETYGRPEEIARDFGDTELGYYSGVIEIDSKNYHCWSNRQWFIRTLDSEEVWNRELDYTKELIDDDQRNNSAWNQRWVVCHRGGKRPSLPLDAIRSEADFALESGARIDPYNESPLRYLVALLRERSKETGPTCETSKLMLEYERKVASLAEVLVSANRDPDGCANLTSARIDLLELAGDEASLGQSIKMARDLETVHDTIRRKFWRLRIGQMQEKLAASSSSA